MEQFRAQMKKLRNSYPIYLLSPTPREGVLSLPMIGFEQLVENIDFSSCDTLMFTSKQAVVTVDTIDKKWRDIPSIAVGSTTKKQIEALGGEVIYHPKNFYGEELAQDIETFFSHREILYLRPKTIMFDSKGYLAKKNIVLQEQIIYETSCIDYKPTEQPPNNSIIIFTSPSTIHCFLENFTWLESYRAIVIGKTTKIHLPTNAIYFIADTPTINACIVKAYEVTAMDDDI
jgi:uroporphyrinogen-III synthase